MSRSGWQRSVEDFLIGSVWAYSNDPAQRWPDKPADAVFVITEIVEFEGDSTLVYCFVLDDLNTQSRYLGKPTAFTLGSAMAFNSTRIV
jgi:hypothetical protein